MPGEHAITLHFTPKGLGNAQEPWLLAPKANACVGCGAPQQVPQQGERGDNQPPGAEQVPQQAERGDNQPPEGQQAPQQVPAVTSTAAAVHPVAAAGPSTAAAATSTASTASAPSTAATAFATSTTSTTTSDMLAGKSTAAVAAAGGLMRWSVVPPSFRGLLP